MKAKKLKSESESDLQLRVCKYIKETYPDVIFTFDAGGFRLPIGYALKMKRMRSGNGIPDLIILQPNKRMYGLFIELKKEGTKTTKKDGSPVSEHFAEQFSMLKRLEEKNYCAVMCVGYEDTKKYIDWYLRD